MNAKEISGFIDSEGKLTSLPSRKKKKLLALVWLAEQIPADMEYSEKEFSDLLRRELYDCFLINRDPDGQKYCLNPKRPDAEALMAKYCGGTQQ